MPNYPTSLDALANPGPLTLRNDPGFELHAVVSTLNDIAEALEAKVGIGASAPGATPAVLRRTASGASAWGQVATGDIAANAVNTGNIAANAVNHVALDFKLATEVNGAGIPAGTWLNVIPSQIYTVDDASSIIEVSVRGVVEVTATAPGSVVASRLLYQNATTFGPLGGGLILTTSGYVNALQGAGTLLLPNDGAGARQITVEVYCSTAATLYCRTSTVTGEGLAIVVMERKR